MGSEVRPLYPRVDSRLIASLGSVLRPCVLGSIFVIIDVWFSDSVVTVDFFHDAIGYAAILVGLTRLRPLVGAQGGVGRLAFITAIAWLSLAESVLGMATAWGAFDLVRQVMDPAQILALGFFLVLMRRLCAAAMDLALVRYWNRAIYAWLIVYAIPVVPLTALGLMIGATDGERMRIGPGAGAVWLAFLLAAIVPLVLILYATARTIRWVAPARLRECHVCGYSLSNLEGVRCPECGTEFATERGSMGVGSESGASSGQ